MKARRVGSAHGWHRRALLLAGLALTSGTGNAQESDASVATKDRPHVRVRVVGVLGRDAVLKQRIISWFEPARFVVNVESASYLEPERVLAPERGSRVEAWVTRRSEKLARLYFASVDPDTRKTRYLLRDLTLESGLDEVGSEELAQAVHLSTVALLEGQAASSREQIEASLHAEPESSTTHADPTSPASTRPEALAAPAASPASSSSPVATRASRDAAPKLVHDDDYAVSGAVGYGVDYRGDEGWAHGPRARLCVGRGGWGAVARLGFVVPHERELTSLRLSWTGGAGFIGASYRHRVSQGFAIGGFAGPSLALIRYSSRARSDVDFDAGPAATELRPQLVFAAIFAIGTSPRVALIPELAVALGTTHYDLERSGRREVIARASRLQPGLCLELEL